VAASASGGYAPAIRLMNNAGNGNGNLSQVGIDLNVYNIGVTAPSARIVATDTGFASADIDFQTKVPPSFSVSVLKLRRWRPNSETRN